jgi:hypothetical protein
MKRSLNARNLFLFVSFIFYLLSPLQKSFANDKNISIYAYAHSKSSQDIKKLKRMLDKSPLAPENIICGIGGFEENGDYFNWDCHLFFDNYGYIGAIESDQVRLKPQNAENAIIKLKNDNKYYNSIKEISLDCEPFYERKINNVAFHIAFIKSLKDKKISVYINPKNLVLLEKQNKELLQLFMKTIKNKGKILFPAYSYDRDSPKFEDIKNAINIANKYGVKYELILDTKQSSKLNNRINKLRTIKGINLSSFTIFSLEIDDDNLKSAKPNKYFGTRPYGSVKQQYNNFFDSMTILDKRLIAQEMS